MLNVNIETSPKTGKLILWYLHNKVKMKNMAAGNTFVNFTANLWRKYDIVANSIDESRSSLINQKGRMSISKSFMIQILIICLV
jgi:hypothetical protein